MTSGYIVPSRKFVPIEIFEIGVVNNQALSSGVFSVVGILFAGKSTDSDVTQLGFIVADCV